MTYDYGWIQVLPWSEWRETERGRRMLEDSVAMTDAHPDDLVNVLTVCVRADRFCEGYLAEAASTGLLARAATRAASLLRVMETTDDLE